MLDGNNSHFFSFVPVLFDFQGLFITSKAGNQLEEWDVKMNRMLDLPP
jgi:hypothetical protein